MISVLPSMLLFAAALDPVAQRGFDHFYNLEFPEAIADFQRAVAAAPKDPNCRNYLAQAVLFQLMFRAGALETEMVTGGNPFLRSPKMEPTPAEQKLFNSSIDECLALTREALKKNPNDAEALYAEGAAIGFRGTYNFLVTKAWFDALRDVTTARKLHNRVVELQPSNIDARMMQGVNDYIVGSLPFSYRFLGFLAGIRGDREAGIRTVQLVAEKGDLNKVDAMILLGVAARRDRRPADAIPICNRLLQMYPRNFLVLFELSQMYADLGEKEKAMQALDRVEELKRTGAPGFQRLPVERIEFARGNLLFWYDEPGTAVGYLKAATANAQVLDPNSGVTAWLRLGQSLDLLGRREEAKAAYQAAAAYWPTSEEAKAARRYLSKPFTAAEKASLSG
jgi:tetratricopeptide (TPR) repeat protein